MRILFICISLLIIYKSSNSQQLSSFNINGKFNSDTLTGKTYLYYPVKEKWIKDSCHIVKGAFSFAGKLMHPVLGRLGYKNKMTEIFLEPATMKVLLTNEQLEPTEISGSLSENEFREINNKIKKINSRWQSVIDTLSAVNRRSNTTFQELKSWVLEPYFDEIREAYLDFFKQNPQSYVTAYFLAINVIEMNQGNLTTDSLKEYYDKFPTLVKNSWYGEKITEELARRKIAIRGTEAYNFTKTDLNGQPLSLSSFRGKYVLLDFWGSWCVPCRKGNPYLKELYFRYKEKGFDIIGIAADNNTKDAWHKAIEKDGLPWHHILINDLGPIYNIISYPTKILIDKNGVIIGRFGSDEKELDDQLSSIFKNIH
jgi:thiol-disulfide isomerase/thioredoxin